MEEIEEIDFTDSGSSSSWIIPVAVGIAGFIGGIGVGFQLAKKKFYRAEVHELPQKVEMDLGDMREDIHDVPVVDSRPEPVVITKEAAIEKGIIKIDDLSDLKPSMIDPDVADEDDSPDDEEPTPEDDEEFPVEIPPEGFSWDWETELAQRNETAPYVITQEEFVLNEKNYHQQSLTYYTMDNVLADEDGAPVYNWASVIGPLAFGHGTRNDDMFFVRNDERKAEYEISKLDEHHAQAVLGIEIEQAAERRDLRHSRDLRFRASD